MPSDDKTQPRFLKFFQTLFFVLTALMFGIAASLSVLAQDSPFPSFSKKPAAADSSGTPKKKEAPQPVEINGDRVEFLTGENKFVAEGNVVVIKGDTRMTCDRIEFYRDTKVAHAQGQVILTSSQGTITADKMIYNFGTMKGEFEGARIASDPFYGAGKSLAKVGDNHLQMNNGYLTTCDHDKPHFRFASRKIDIYPGDKMVARNVKMIIGKIPIMYMPRHTQLLNQKPRVTYTPGYSKVWGAFLLQNWRYDLGKYIRGTLHLDYREKKAFAPGIDIKYNTPKTGNGIIRLYYMNELTPQRRHFWQPKTGKTIARERFKAEWRHKWTIDSKTEAIWQYYKLSDDGFLKDFFKRDFNREPSPASFFLLTRTLPAGSFSFRTDARVNRFTGGVERLPEIKYDLSNQKIGGTGLYFRTSNTYSNLTIKSASPTEVRKSTMRVDTDNDISYPMKIKFIEFRPLVGGRQTYYTRTNDSREYSVIRGIFNTGADMSTKFFKVYDIHKEWMGIAINRLRHIITPSIAYRFTPDPTILPSRLDQYDGIDAITRDHTVTLSLENKLQTKRNDKSVDLLRTILSTPFRLKEYPGKGGFEAVTSKIEFKPARWLEFDMDTSYNPHAGQLSSANFDIYLNRPEADKWYLNFGKRFNANVDDQITTEFGYKINPKWKLKVYERHDIDRGNLKEQGFTITRDLHEWEMDLLFTEKRGEGSEILFVFRLKAFPDSAIDFGSGFNKRKTGSQSSIGN